MPQVRSTRPWTQSGLSPKRMRLMAESLLWSFLPSHFRSPCAAQGPPDLGTEAAKSSRNDRGASGLASHLGEEVAGRESGPAREADTQSAVSWCRGSGAVRLLDGSSSITLGLAGGDQEWLSHQTAETWSGKVSVTLTGDSLSP